MSCRPRRRTVVRIVRTWRWRGATPSRPPSQRSSAGWTASKYNTLKEESDFRNERDVVPAGIRAGPNPQNFVFVFLETWYTATRRRDREFLEFLSFLSVFVCFPWELVSGRGVFLFKVEHIPCRMSLLHVGTRCVVPLTTSSRTRRERHKECASTRRRHSIGQHS